MCKMYCKKQKFQLQNFPRKSFLRLFGKGKKIRKPFESLLKKVITEKLNANKMQ
jgi:hypothetical protein